MKSYTVNVSAIIAENGASIDFDDAVPVESVRVGDTLAVFGGPLHVHASIVNTGRDLTLYGSVTGCATLECSRCLEPYTCSVEGSLSGLIVDGKAGTALPDDEEWYLLTDESTVDLMPAILAALVLEIPFAPLHAEECRGICPECGCDLNHRYCSCVPPATGTSSPFSALKDLLEPPQK